MQLRLRVAACAIVHYLCTRSLMLSFTVDRRLSRFSHLDIIRVMDVAQVHTTPKKSTRGSQAAAVAGRSPAGRTPGQPGFTDSNASWLKPKASARKTPSANLPRKKAIASAQPELGSSLSGTDSEDKPLPGELSDGGESLFLSDDSDGALDADGIIGGLSGSSTDEDDGSGAPAGGTRGVAAGSSALSNGYPHAQHPDG